MELIRVPKVAEAVTEGTVSRWHVGVGDRVEADAPLVEMITEKAEDDVRSPAAGRVAVVCAPERSTVPVGYVLCALAEEGETLPDIEAMNAEVLRRHQALLMGELPEDEPVDNGPTLTSHFALGSPKSTVPASPAAKRLAREAKVDLAEVAAELNISERVSADDVRKFLEDRG